MVAIVAVFWSFSPAAITIVNSAGLFSGVWSSVVLTPEACCFSCAQTNSPEVCVDFCRESREAYGREEDGTCTGLPAEPTPSPPPQVCTQGERRPCEVCNEQQVWRALEPIEMDIVYKKDGQVVECVPDPFGDIVDFYYYDSITGTECRLGGSTMCFITGQPPEPPAESGTGSGFGEMKALYEKATKQEKTFTGRNWELKATVQVNPIATGETPRVEASLELTGKTKAPPTTGNIIARTEPITSITRFEDLPTVDIELDDTASADHIFSLFFAKIAPEETFKYKTGSHYLRFWQSVPTGTLSVTSTPDGATVTVDGDYAGTTPLSVPLAAGAHIILIEKEGYLEHEETIDIRPNEIAAVAAVLQSDSGTLFLTTVPQGVTVTIDGSFQGYTPYSASGMELPPGTYALGLSKAGYVSQTRTVTIERGKATSLSVTMVAQGTLRVVSNIKGSAVTANGKSLGLTNTAFGTNKWRLDTPLAPGSYKVVVSRSGYKAQTFTGVAVASGKITTKTVTLKK